MKKFRNDKLKKARDLRADKEKAKAEKLALKDKYMTKEQRQREIEQASLKALPKKAAIIPFKAINKWNEPRPRMRHEMDTEQNSALSTNRQIQKKAKGLIDEMMKARSLLHEEDDVVEIQSKSDTEADYGLIEFSKDQRFGTIDKKETVKEVLDSTLRHREIRNKARKEVHSTDIFNCLQMPTEKISNWKTKTKMVNPKMADLKASVILQGDTRIGRERELNDF